MQLKQITMTLLLTLGSVVTASAALITGTGTKPSVGNGNSGSPYEIRTAEELRWFVNYENTRHWFPNDYAKLMADIDLSTICGPDKGSWIPLGHAEEDGAVGCWKGKLYGNGYTVSGLYIDGNDLYPSAVGFCGKTNGVTITDLTLRGRIVNAKGSVGSLMGEVGTGTVSISNCVSYVDLSIEPYFYFGYLGGLIGYNTASGHITRCSFQGTITGRLTYFGSLIAYHSGSANVTECSGYSNGESGLIGLTNCENIVSNCISDKYILYNYTGTYRPWEVTHLCNNIYVDKEYLFMGEIESNTEGGEAMTADDIASGAACYRMNQKMGGKYFTQTIGTDHVPFPNDSRSTVYRVKKYTTCGKDKDNWEWAYSNTDEDDTTLREHLFDSDHLYCTRCGDAVNPDYGIDKDAEGYYLADCVDDIKWLWNLVNVTGITDAKIRLTADIDMAGEAMEPLTLYSGELDGQGHTLGNINISCSGVVRVGLVGKLRGTVRNLTLTGTVEGSYASYIGAFAAYVDKGAKISNVRNDCTVKATGTVGGDVYSYIGGVAGYSDGSITYAINNGPVVDASTCTGTLKRYIAGVAGYVIPYTEVSHLANNGVVGAYGEAQNGNGAAVVNVRDASYYSDSYYVTGISNPGLEYFYSDRAATETDTAVTPIEVGSGRLAWQLAGKNYDADDSATVFFGQTIGTDMVPYPFVSECHKGVYNARHYYTCDSYSDYSNSPTDEEPAAHSWNDSHYCTVCCVINPEYMQQDATTKAYLVKDNEQYNTFAGALNAAYKANKPMKYASASIQNDLDFSLCAPTVVTSLFGRIHGNGHKFTFGCAGSVSNVATSVYDEGVIEYLDVVFPSDGFYPMVYENLGRIVGCNIAHGVAAGSSAGLVIDCSGELPSTKNLYGRHTRCLIKTFTIDGAKDYRVYNSTVSPNVCATYEEYSLEKGETGELAYMLSHGYGGGEWGQHLGVEDAEPRIYYKQTPKSSTFVAHISSYSAAQPEGKTHYVNAGQSLEYSPGYYHFVSDPESWTDAPWENFIADRGEDIYTATGIELDASVEHYLPYEVEAKKFKYSEEFEEGEIVSMVLPVEIPVSVINGKVYLFRGYNATDQRLEFVHSDEVAYIPANTPMLVVAKKGEILGSYSESSTLMVMPMLGAQARVIGNFSHLASYRKAVLPTEGDICYYYLSGVKKRNIAETNNGTAANARVAMYSASPSVMAVPATEGYSVSPFDSYFAIPASLQLTSSIPVVLQEDVMTGIFGLESDCDGISFPCDIWNLSGVKVMCASDAADLKRLCPGIYILRHKNKCRRIAIR